MYGRRIQIVDDNETIYVSTPEMAYSEDCRKAAAGRATSSARNARHTPSPSPKTILLHDKAGRKITLKRAWDVFGLAILSGSEVVVADAQRGVVLVIDPSNSHVKYQLRDERLVMLTCIAGGGGGRGATRSTWPTTLMTTAPSTSSTMATAASGDSTSIANSSAPRSTARTAARPPSASRRQQDACLSRDDEAEL